MAHHTSHMSSPSPADMQRISRMLRISSSCCSAVLPAAAAPCLPIQALCSSNSDNHRQHTSPITHHPSPITHHTSHITHHLLQPTASIYGRMRRGAGRGTCGCSGGCRSRFDSTKFESRAARSCCSCCRHTCCCCCCCCCCLWRWSCV